MDSIFNSNGIASYIIRKDNGLFINIENEGTNFNLENIENDIIDIAFANENKQISIQPKAAGSHSFKLSFTNKENQSVTKTIEITVVEKNDETNDKLLYLKLQDQNGTDIELPLHMEKGDEKTFTIRTKLTDCEVISKNDGITAELVSTTTENDVNVLTIKLTATKSGIQNAVVSIKGNREVSENS